MGYESDKIETPWWQDQCEHRHIRRMCDECNKETCRCTIERIESGGITKFIREPSCKLIRHT